MASEFSRRQLENMMNSNSDVRAPRTRVVSQPQPQSIICNNQLPNHEEDKKHKWSDLKVGLAFLFVIIAVGLTYSYLVNLHEKQKAKEKRRKKLLQFTQQKEENEETPDEKETNSNPSLWNKIWGGSNSNSNSNEEEILNQQPLCLPPPRPIKNKRPQTDLNLNSNSNMNSLPFPFPNSQSHSHSSPSTQKIQMSNRPCCGCPINDQIKYNQAMTEYRQWVVPFVTQIRKDFHFWNHPMKVPCFLCFEIPWDHMETLKHLHLGEKEVVNRLRPYPIIFQINRTQKIIEVWEVVCRTCFLNFVNEKNTLFNPSQLISWTSEYRVNILQTETAEPEEPYTEKEEEEKEEERGVWTGKTTPPLLTLKKFGGTLEWTQYNDPSFAFQSPTTQNKFECQPPSTTHTYVLPSSSSNFCCWGCKQKIEDSNYLPVVWSWEKSDLIKEVRGCFHLSGSCAKSYLMSLPGHMKQHRLLKTQEYWSKHHLCSFEKFETLPPQPDLRIPLEKGFKIKREESGGWGPPYFLREEKEKEKEKEEILFLDHPHYDIQPSLSSRYPNKKMVWKEDYYQPLNVYKSNGSCVQSEWKMYIRTQTMESKGDPVFQFPETQKVNTHGALSFLEILQSQKKAPKD